MIPHRIHQIWIGQDPLPDIYYNCQRTIISHHQDWEYFYWENTYIFSEFQEDCQSYVDRCIACNNKSIARIKDLLSLCVLYKYGGIYADSDLYFIRTIPDSLLQNEYILFKSVHGYVGEHLLGWETGSPILRSIIHNLISIIQPIPWMGKFLEGLDHTMSQDYSMPHNQGHLARRYKVTNNTLCIHLWRGMQYRLPILPELEKS